MATIKTIEAELINHNGDTVKKYCNIEKWTVDKSNNSATLLTETENANLFLGKSGYVLIITEQLDHKNN